MNAKIEAVLKELTLEEKAGMIHGAQLFQTAGVERLSIPPLKMSDGPMGVRNEFDKSRWVTVGNEDDYVTYLPSNSAIAATWNRDLAYESGKVLGEEARGRGKDVILAPGVNIKRNPVCGRNFEYFSEDPYLVSELCAPMVRGIQEADVAACVKHFALNNQETERLWVNVEIDERALREIYLPGFLAAVKEGGSYSIMGAYNLFRGEHCCQNEALLSDILRKEWEYDGTVISDWGAVHDTEKAAKSPLDVEMSVTPDFDEYFMANPLIAAVRAGEIKEEAIDGKVRNILRLMLRLKMIDVAVPLSKGSQNNKGHVEVSANPERKAGAYNTPAHREKTLEAARECIVLLKNEDNRLPLAPKKRGKLVVIGDNAKRRQSLGGGSAEIKALYEIVPLMGIKSYLGGSREVVYAPGYYVPEKKAQDCNWQADSVSDEGQKDAKEDVENAKEAELQKKLRDEAVALAKEAEDVIIIGGLNHEHDVEGRDRDSLTLPYAQDELIEAVLSVNPNAVVIMFAGSPVSMQRWSGRAKAILWMGYCGMEGGTALAEILFGDVNPSGKLAETLPFRLEDSSAYALADGFGRALSKELKEEEEGAMNAHMTQSYTDGLLVGYRYYEKKNVPVQFPFGHGLSYTTFSYGNIALKQKEAAADGRKLIANVSVTVTNTGSRAGKEAIQAYVGKKDAAADEPTAELKGFEKVFLKPGESCEVTIPLYEDSCFSFYDVEKKRFALRHGTYIIRVGSSLTDVKGTLEIRL